jgi:sugar phosphate isomerase/epimerase
MNLNRRKFIKRMAAVTAVLPVTGISGAAASVTAGKKYSISLFSKPLDPFGIDFMAESVAMAGIDGLDPTVRPGGLVEPGSVAGDLPKIIETGHQYKLKTEMMVTSILSAEEPHAEKVLSTAASLGVRHYRLGWYRYDLQKGIRSSLAEVKEKLEGLVALNEGTGIQGGYQNHSGIMVGAPMWDVWELIRDLPVERISSQFDIRHAVTEGANSWILGLHLLSRNIGSLAIKDFTWEVKDGKARLVSVPLGEGIIDFDRYFATLKELNIVTPITLHVEYPLLNKEEESLSLLQKQKIIVGKLKKDANFIRSKLAKYQME